MLENDLFFLLKDSSAVAVLTGKGTGKRLSDITVLNKKHHEERQLHEIKVCYF